jgi:hypothetical protein
MTANTVLAVSLKNTKADLFEEVRKLSAEKQLLVQSCGEFENQVSELQNELKALQEKNTELTEKVMNLTTVCNDYKAELDHLQVSDDTTDETGMPSARPASDTLSEFAKRMGIKPINQLWEITKITQDHDRFVLWADRSDWSKAAYDFFARLRDHARSVGGKANFQNGKLVIVIRAKDAIV